jgi:hypothetical protein
MMRPVMLSALLAAAALLGACHPDPVHSDKVAAQGPEDPGIPTGPLHRAGQPCLVCHGDAGPASMVMSFAGTLYQDSKSRKPLEGAIVQVFDSAGHKTATATNCMGNFFIQKRSFDPVWPAWVQVQYAGQPVQMNSPIFRDGSCADCHHDPPSRASAGHVYYAPQGVPMNFPAGGCK